MCVVSSITTISNFTFLFTIQILNIWGHTFGLIVYTFPLLQKYQMLKLSEKLDLGGLVRWLHPCPLSPLTVFGRTIFATFFPPDLATAKIDPHTKWSKAKYLQHSWVTCRPKIDPPAEKGGTRTCDKFGPGPIFVVPRKYWMPVDGGGY